MGQHDLILVLLLATIYSSVILYAANVVPFKSRHHIAPRNEVLDCTAELSKDLYGLGVRLGIYFQWFSGWVSNNYIIDEVGGGLDANAIFLFALLVSIVSSTKSDELAQIDALIMLMLSAGTVWGVLSIFGYRTLLYRKEGPDAIKRFGGFGTHLRLLLGAASAWYLVWFWTLGIQGLPKGIEPFGKTHPDACVEVTVFKVPIRGGMRYPILALGIATAIFNLFPILVTPLAAVTRLKKLIHFMRHRQYASSTRLRYATVASQWYLHKMSCWFGTLNFIWMLFTAVLVEITLNENYMQGVLGARASLGNGGLTQPGQLLPMLIGTFSFVRVLFIVFELARNPNFDISPSLGRDVSRVNTPSAPGALKGLNIFKLFSAGNALPDKAQSNVEAEDDAIDPEYTEFLEKVKHMGIFKKVMLTWLPWLTLLYFWPWTRSKGLPVSQKDDHADQVPLRTSPRGRYSEWEDDGKLGGVQTSYRGVSRNSTDGRLAEETRPMV